VVKGVTMEATTLKRIFAVVIVGVMLTGGAAAYPF
jgi:hypothetical protein